MTIAELKAWIQEQRKEATFSRDQWARDLEKHASHEYGRNYVRELERDIQALDELEKLVDIARDGERAKREGPKTPQ
jgi:predicted secreted Zn-dependent protease